MPETANFDKHGRTGPWIQSYSGRALFPLDPRPGDFSIIDIAHALGNMCRYGGHCRTFYSVAEHSVLVSQWLEKQGYDPRTQFDGLMHDATEGAGLVDLPRPIKKAMPTYREAEDRNWLAISEQFGCSATLSDAVHEADLAVLMREKELLLGPSPGPWSINVPPADVQLQLYGPRQAANAFLDRFGMLTAMN